MNKTQYIKQSKKFLSELETEKLYHQSRVREITKRIESIKTGLTSVEAGKSSKKRKEKDISRWTTQFEAELERIKQNS